MWREALQVKGDEPEKMNDWKMNSLFSSLIKWLICYLLPGLYSCHATNSQGSGNSNVVSLIVQCKIPGIIIRRLARSILLQTLLSVWARAKLSKWWRGRRRGWSVRWTPTLHQQASSESELIAKKLLRWIGEMFHQFWGWIVLSD